MLIQFWFNNDDAHLNLIVHTNNGLIAFYLTLVTVLTVLFSFILIICLHLNSVYVVLFVVAFFIVRILYGPPTNPFGGAHDEFYYFDPIHIMCPIFWFHGILMAIIVSICLLLFCVRNYLETHDGFFYKLWNQCFNCYKIHEIFFMSSAKKRECLV